MTRSGTSRCRSPADATDSAPTASAPVSARCRHWLGEALTVAGVQLSIDDDPDTAVGFYESKLSSEGWTIEETQEMDGKSMLRATKGERAIHLLITEGEYGGSEIFMISQERGRHIFEIGGQFLRPYLMCVALWYSQFVSGCTPPALTRKVTERRRRRPAHSHLHIVMWPDWQLTAIDCRTARVLSAMFGCIPAATCQIQTAGKCDCIVKHHYFLMMRGT